MQWAIVIAAFLASAVEFVEAFTLVLVAGITVNWRSAIVGALAAVVTLVVIVATLGVALVTLIPLDVLRFVIGFLLLLFGLKWLKNAIQRYSGLKFLHDEEAIYAANLAQARARGEPVKTDLDTFGVLLSYKSVLLEGLEVAFIVISFGGSGANGIGLAALEREKITMNYVHFVDMVLYVIACDAQLSMSEMQVIETIRNAGHEHIFFVCNRINVIDEEEQDLVKGRCISQLAPLTNKGAKHVFFLDAPSALDARVKGDTEQLERSGSRAIEEELKAFFAAERGREKIRQPVAELKASIQEAHNKLAGVRESVRPRTDQEAEIQSWRARSQSELDQLESERQQIVSWLNEFRDETRKQVTGTANEFYGNVASKLEALAQGYEIKRPVSIARVFFQEQQERVVKEVSSCLADEVSRMCKAWQRATLEPILKSRMEGLTQELIFFASFSNLSICGGSSTCNSSFSVVGKHQASIPSFSLRHTFLLHPLIPLFPALIQPPIHAIF